MFHMVAYTENYSSATTLSQLAGITDTVLTERNNDYIITDPFNLGLVYGLGATITELQFNWPTYNSYGYHQIYEYDYNGTTESLPPDRPALVDYLSSPMVVPTNEQLDIQVSNSPGTTEQNTLLLWLFTPGHSFTLPTGIMRLTLRATISYTPATAYVWSGAQTLTFETTFKGGWYAVVGLDCMSNHQICARLIFPKSQLYNGRALRPGCICRSSLGNRAAERFIGRLGCWGYFNSFEQPYIEFLPSTTGAKTGTVAMDVIYLGNTEPTGLSC